MLMPVKLSSAEHFMYYTIIMDCMFNALHILYPEKLKANQLMNVEAKTGGHFIYTCNIETQWP